MSDELFHLVFVCTGNSCRSPLAEALARREAEQRGWSGVKVSSAGVAAGAGSPASEGSLLAGEEAGLDLSEHRSRPLSTQLVDEADLLLAMSPHHLVRLRELGGGEKSTLITAFARGLDEGESLGAPGVPDPFGADLAEYRRTLDHLDGLVREVFDRLEPILAP